MDAPVLWLGTLACAIAAAAGLLPVERRIRLAALAVALAIAPALVLADSWDGEQLVDLRDRPALLLTGAAAAIAGLAIMALILRRRPGLLAPALVAVLPFRVPIDLGGEELKLLVPLYAVIAAGLIAAIWESRRGEGEPIPRREGWIGLIGPALGGIVVLYALQATYADDLTPALQNVAFFLAPFAALFHLLERVKWDRATLLAIVWVLAAEAVLFLLVGAVQYVTGDLFWNDKVISGNEAHPYFRVNSLFWDPNILGRYLVITMTVLAAIVAFARRPREIVGAGATFAVLLLLLVASFSQTSSLALFAGLCVLVAARWGLRTGIASTAAILLALAAAVVLLAGGGLSSETTSGRAGLIDGGLEIAGDHPLVGVGAGGFAPEFTARYYEGEGFAAESHTEPVTVAAEQGIVGVLAYAAFLIVTIGALLGATGLHWRRRATGPPLAAVLLAIYALMVVHSLGYAAFFTDPVTWVVLAVAAAALSPAAVRTPAGGPAPAPRGS